MLQGGETSQGKSPKVPTTRIPCLKSWARGAPAATCFCPRSKAGEQECTPHTISRGNRNRCSQRLRWQPVCRLFLRFPQHSLATHRFHTEDARFVLVPWALLQQSVCRRSVGCPEPLDNIAQQSRNAVPSRVTADGVGRGTHSNAERAKDTFDGSSAGKIHSAAAGGQASNLQPRAANIPHGNGSNARMPRGASCEQAEGPGRAEHALCGSGGWPGPHSFCNSLFLRPKLT